MDVMTPNKYFNPLPSWEGRPAVGLMELWVDHFNPLPSWEGRHHSVNTSLNLSCISIHSLREKGDRSYPIIIPAVSYFNPLPSWEGRRGNIPVVFAFELFQSTPFVRRETWVDGRICMCHKHFNPLPSWEGRQNHHQPTLILLDISIHSLREKGDNIALGLTNGVLISIHSLREKGD